MSNAVNPPPQLRMPQGWQNDPNIRPFVSNMLTVLRQLWTRTGGGEDGFTSLNSLFAELDDITAQSIPKTPVVVSVDDDYELSGEDLVITQAPVTITLNPTPDDMELTKVKMMYRTLLDGNGRTIDGAETKLIETKYTSLDLLYLIDSDEWVIV
tara:strand:- start:9450 stop:9911 length:462 start_codon:yes stop_codon:yes gene_type:complete